MTGPAGDRLFTPEQVADQLGLHVRTVRRYIREGRLEAVQVGKRYRVPREALEAFAGISLEPSEPHGRVETDVATIVGIDDLDRTTADRLTTYLMASTGGRRDAEGPMRVETIYYPERRRLKIVCNGDLASTMSLLALINTLIEERK
jgi:excisionase family DNA binding protein